MPTPQFSTVPSTSWNDTSSICCGFSSAPARKPSESTLRLGRLTLRIHRHPRFPGQWMVECPGLFTSQLLVNRNLSEAKLEAERLFLGTLTESVAVLGKRIE